MAGGRRGWLGTLAAAAAGFALGAVLLASGALLLYTGEGVLASAGFLIALALGSLAAGTWAAGPQRVRRRPGGRPGRLVGRWTLAIGSLVVASFTAMAWLRFPALQVSAFGPPLALVFLMAEPAYALGALVAALEARRRSVGREAAAGTAVPALLGAAAGVLLAGLWLIPALPPGPLFLGAALLLAVAGTLEMGSVPDATEEGMAGSVALITGVGGRGQMGYALASAFLDGGARVLMAGRSEAVESHAAELGDDCAAVWGDLATEAGAAAAVEAARSRWGRLDVLVNAAGGLRVIKPLSDTTAEEWDDELSRNARTAFLVSRAALPLLRESKGAIVNFASPAAMGGGAGLGAYSAGKAAVVALTRAMAAEEKANGVRVNAVAPGMIDTESNRAAVEDHASVDWVSREQVADAVLFLAGREGSGVTGQVMNVEGRGGG